MSLRRLFPIALFVALAPLAFCKERWLYLSTNLQVDQRADDAVALLERAHQAGYTHLLIADSKFAHLEQVSPAYAPNVAKVKAAADRLGIEIVPSVFPVGYSNDALFHDPNLAEGLPVKDAPFVVKGGVAEIQKPASPLLPSAIDRRAWDFVDDSLAPDSDAMRSAAGDGNARLCKKVHLEPFRQYHLSAEIRTEALSGGVPELKAIGAKGMLQWTNVKVAADQPFTRCDVTFNSLENADVTIYLGVWGGHKGTLWWRAPVLEECGPVNLLRRPGAPLKVVAQNGRTLVEGKDYDQLADPLLGQEPWAGAYKPWHAAPALHTHGIPDGEILKVSYYHSHIIGDEQVCGCVEEPAFQAILNDQARRVAALWKSRTHLMAHDEWRVLGWDESCAKAKEAPGKIIADNARFCTGLLEKNAPGGRILVWSDMFDPHHNALAQYYLVNGSLEGSWEGLSPKVEVMNWNYGGRVDSLKFFADKGHAQVIAGYYDEDVAHVRDWIAAAAGVPNVKGFMYTTWRGDYSKLEEVAKILSDAGW